MAWSRPLWILIDARSSDTWDKVLVNTKIEEHAKNKFFALNSGLLNGNPSNKTSLMGTWAMMWNSLSVKTSVTPPSGVFNCCIIIPRIVGSIPPEI